MVLSDANATDFDSYVSLPIFRDPSPGRMAWLEMAPGAVKHDTFVFSQAGTLALYWDASQRTLSHFAQDIRAAVEALAP